MNDYRPPIVTGRFPSNALRLFGAALVMLVLDLPLVAVFFTAVPFIFFIQFIIVLAILLLAARRRVAVLLLLLVSAAYFARYGLMGCSPDIAWFPPTFLLGPIWIGTFISHHPCNPPSPDAP